MPPLYREAGETRSMPSAPADGIRVADRLRRFPEGTCRPLRIVEVLGGPGSSLEDLVNRRRNIVAERIPDFSLAAVRPQHHFVGADRVDHLLDQLGGGGLRFLEELPGPGERVLFNGRNLVTCRYGGSFPTEALPASDLEVLLYAAFLYQSLLRFSERLSDLVPLKTNPADPAQHQALA